MHRSMEEWVGVDLLKKGQPGMADLDDLGYTSVADMNNDEALELLRQIRLSRRTPTKPTRPTKTRAKAPSVDSNQAAEILKILTEGGK